MDVKRRNWIFSPFSFDNLEKYFFDSLSQKFQTTERIIIFITTCINNDYTNAAEAIIVKVLITCFIGIIRLGNIHYINPPVIERAITTFLWPTFFVAKYFLPFHNFAGMKCNES